MKDLHQFFVFCLVLCLLSLRFPGTSWSMDKVDHSLYADLLSRYVKDGVVDYRGFQEEEKKIDRYLKVLETTDTKKLSRTEQFAFFINAYNAWTIKLILSGYPAVKSIKDLGTLFKSPWKKKIVRVDGKIITLDDVEHNILRPRFKDPRVHFAINCASKGCPPLISEPYEGDILDQQLHRSVRSFLNNPERNRLEGTTLYVSKIFKWFAKDFEEDIVGFFIRFVEGDTKKKLLENKDKIRVKYLDYDWSLNGK